MSDAGGSPPPGLATQSARAVMWTSAQKWVVRIGGFATVAILARMLTPEDFGLVAIAMTVIPFLYLISDFGFVSYIVQADDLDQRKLSTAFWYSSGAGLVLTGAMVASAPLVAAVLRTPEAATVLAAVAPAAFIAGLASVPIALLRRNMRFRLLSVQATAAGLLAQIVAIVGAFVGWGVYALVAQLLVSQLVAALLAWAWGRWVPGLRFSLRDLGAMAGFGIKVVGVDLVAIVRSWIEVWLITITLGATGLGYLNIAQRLIQVSQDLSAAAITPVSTVVFAKVRAEPERLRSGYVRSQSVSFAVVMPVMAFIAVAAPALVPFVFGPGWETSVVPAQILAVAGILTVSALLDQGLFIGAGKPGRWLAYALVIDLLTVLATLVAVQFGLVAVTVGFVIVCCVATATRWVLVARLTRTPVRRIAAPVLRSLPAGAFASAVAVAAFLICAALPEAIQIAVTGIVLLGAYVALVRLTQPALYREIIALTVGLLRRSAARREGQG
ncbi:lipopolysaccharide biosynthesis protein [Microbacterium caowuchunii]|uniref:lipopolysaccharide biosynthesis protein n=1 Tax=Microbacterium caowuchunii TaxID=2614638 RepID=UPI001787387A|nr:lipopolysaccharide biosynthesis protein [Microbacterium caowuchunii]